MRSDIEGSASREGHNLYNQTTGLNVDDGNMLISAYQIMGEDSPLTSSLGSVASHLLDRGARLESTEQIVYFDGVFSVRQEVSRALLIDMERVH